MMLNFSLKTGSICFSLKN